MSGRVHRDFRKQTNAAARGAAQEAVENLSPALQAVARGGAETRAHVVSLQSDVQELQCFQSRGLRARLRWLFLGN